MKRFAFIVMACLLVLVGCDRTSNTASKFSSADELVGVYGTMSKKDGRVVPMIKVAKEGSAYILYEFSHGDWHRPKKSWLEDSSGGHQEVRPFTRADLEKLVNHPVDVEPLGVQTKALALIRVPVGWSDGGKEKPFVTKSGYFAMTLLGPIDLQRM
ncbi:hypothetical protein GO286_04820 [Ralstonia solanacearum]|uniref:hypothetical protein n=1 Tax=Ralstonia pseudosolanacearum TaxID=1310165 RepID=UPI000A5FEA9A|nr:hypothetical protein [Ralstonia pseudosolanacearum]AXV99203.1 hypothetical protein CJO80_26970 [Ralstonia solanacearum]NKF92526.1 hypothetical protein [Ralstonia solanacearum]NKG07126.1 hypothetical protein [Ralstonia solanacearum]RAA07301.1 hypothetical protein DOT67_21255 [Ralstonia pseudosolanacearum]